MIHLVMFSDLPIGVLFKVGDTQDLGDVFGSVWLGCSSVSLKLMFSPEKMHLIFICLFYCMYCNIKQNADVLVTE